MGSPGYGGSRRLDPGLNTELKLSVQVLALSSILIPFLVLGEKYVISWEFFLPWRNPS